MEHAENRHYSDKPGHKDRSDFWRDLKKTFPHQQQITKDLMWYQRRYTRRISLEGKR